MAQLDPQSLPQHVDRLYRAAWALCGSRHDAEDLVQETFARVLAKPRQLRRADELAYLMQVLRNTFLTQRRAAGRRPQQALAALEEIEPADPRGGERPEQAAAAREVFGAIANLPDNYRLALVAVDVLGLSYAEAGVALDTREATIATRVFRARERVARELSEAPMQAMQASDAPPAPTAGTPGATSSTHREEQIDPMANREEQLDPMAAPTQPLAREAKGTHESLLSMRREKP
jgi:RNA polymerase sigma-70 factor (ECF subfamily)